MEKLIGMYFSNSTWLKKLPGCFLLFSICAVSFIGCSRPESEISKIVLTIPPELKLLKATNRAAVESLNTNDPLECFAVSITGPGISTNTRTCGPQTGVLGGFTPSGGTISLEVPKGENRSVSVFMYLAPAGTTTCPSWNTDFESNYGSNFKKTYKLKELNGLSFTRDDESVLLEVGAPASLDNNILAQMGQTEICQPKISGYLTSTGQILNALGLLLADVSHPIHSSISVLNLGDYSLSSFLALSSSSVLFQPSSQVTIPPYLRSIIRHPVNSNSVIGLRDDGSLEEVSLSTGISTTLAASNCGFSTCKVPPWINSITLGPDNKFYGIDHSGNFYLLSALGPEVIVGIHVPPYVVQVVF